MVIKQKDLDWYTESYAKMLGIVFLGSYDMPLSRSIVCKFSDVTGVCEWSYQITDQRLARARHLDLLIGEMCEFSKENIEHWLDEHAEGT